MYKNMFKVPRKIILIFIAVMLSSFIAAKPAQTLAKNSNEKKLSATDKTMNYTLQSLATIKIYGVRSSQISGNRLFVVSMSYFTTVDISDLKHPKILSKIAIPGVGYDIELKGDYAYVASRMAGVQVFNIKNPRKVHYITTYDTLEQATGLAINGNILLVCNRTFGLELVDISQPSHPVFLGKLKTSEAQGVKSRGNYAYIGEHYSKQLTIIDITNPRRPKQLKTVKVPGNAWGVFLKGNYAYVAHGHGKHGISVINIENPAAAFLVTSYTIPTNNKKRSPDCWELTISGNKLFFANGYDGLYLFDITNPEKLKLITSYTDVSYAHEVTVKKDLIALANYKAGLQLISAVGLAGEVYRDSGYKAPIIPTNTLKPKYIKNGNLLKYIPQGQVKDIFIDDKYIYLALGQGGIHILSLKNPQKIIAEIPLNTIVYGITVYKNAIYAACGVDGLWVIDKNSHKIIKRLKMASKYFINDLWLAGDKLIARVDTWGQVNYFDITEPLNPLKAEKNLKISHFMSQVSDYLYKDNYIGLVNFRHFFIYAASGKAGKQKLKKIAELTGENVNDGVVIVDNYAYCTGGWKKLLTVYDLNNIKLPKKIFSQKFATQGRLKQIFYADNRLFVTSEKSVIIFDISDRQQPKFIQEIIIPNIAGNSIYRRIIYKNGHFYLATGHSGLWILKQQ
jgi:hypothetical protein